MIQFENSLYLLLLLLLPCWIVLRHTGIIKKKAFSIVQSDGDGKIFSWKQNSLKTVLGIANILLMIGFLSMIIALANPKAVHQEKKYISRGTEIMFVLDSSPSMSALDIGVSNRLNAAKKVISEIVKNINGTSFGLISMASDAACLVPPTTDIKMFQDQLNSIQIGSMGDGTAIGVGISSAVYHLSSSPAPSKVVVVLTDGENNTGTIHPITAAKLAKEQNIPVYVLGIGTKGTVPVEYTDYKSGKIYSGYLESNFNSESLEMISRITNANYYDITNIDDLSNMLNNIVQNETIIPHFYFVPVDNQYYEFFLVVSLISIILSWIIRKLYLKEVL